MKKNNYFILLFVAMAFMSCTEKGKSYMTSTNTDTNGYSYETVENDPTGLRLYTLENGLKVYLSQNNDEPRIQTYVAVRAGSSYDPKESTGLAHYLEHMVFKGTDQFGTSDWETEKGYIAQVSDLYEKHRAETDVAKKEAIYKQIDSVSYIASGYAIANEYDKMVSSLGATGTNAHTWFEETIYHNKIPANELDKFLKLESAKFNKLVLRLFHTELEAVYEEFNRIQDNDGWKVLGAKLEGLFPKHPYGQQSPIGTSEHLKSPSLIDINNYFDKYYVANNMALILVGDFNFDATIQKVDATFGKLKNKEVTHPELPKEESITGIVKKEVYGPNNESVSVTYRSQGVGSEEEKTLTVLEMILMNGTAGLFDLNLNQKQSVQNANSELEFYNDYGWVTLNGIPKEGQSLDEVKDLMLDQIVKLKNGEFDEEMIGAVINDLKLRQTRGFENSTNLAAAYYSAFTQKQNWSDKVKFLDDLKKIKKEDLVTFANDFFKDNYVVVYKRKGVDESIVKVKNPGITPIQLNRGKQSDYLANFNKIKSKELQPQFVDYKKEIQKTKLDSGVEVAHINNKRNDLFSLNIIFDMGVDNDKKLALAVGYLEFLGTDKYTAEELAKEFYKLGVSYSVNTGTDKSDVSISGIQENFEKGLELLEHLMANVIVDQEAYDKYVANILKGRNDGKTQKDNILFSGLMNYAQYGENSRLRNIISAEELLTIDSSELVDILKDLSNFKHRIFYYGNDIKSSISSLNKLHDVPTDLKDYPPAVEYKQIATGGKVYLVDFDMVQSEIVFIAKGQEFDSKKMALSNVFNSYFGNGLSSIVFQEIRESKSLAYAVQAGYSSAPKKGKDDMVFSYIGTQANKLPQAVDAMMELMNDMPTSEQQFQAAKDAAIKKIASQRITKSSIFWTYEGLLKKGIDYDNREEMYNEIKKMTMEDVRDFFNNNIKGQNYTVSVIGNKKDLDMKALEKLGEVQEIDIDYLFNYTPTKVKQ